MFLAFAALAPGHLQAQKAEETAPTYKLQTERNLVTVRVVVRDAQGTAVENLRQEDFRLFDRGKLQSILSFSVEKPALLAMQPTPQNAAEKPPDETASPEKTVTPASPARRFIGLFFDDVNTDMEDLIGARNAAEHFLKSLVPSQVQVGLYTSSGQNQLDFTGDLAQVQRALLNVRARPLAAKNPPCDIPPYEAYLILDVENYAGPMQPQDVGKAPGNDPATTAAMYQILFCMSPGDTDPALLTQAQSMVQDEARESLVRSEAQATAVLRGIGSLSHRMMSLPGQRSIVVVSGGFQTDTLHYQLSQATDLAMRAGVVVSALDARGLYSTVAANGPIPDASQRIAAMVNDPTIVEWKSQMLADSARRQADGIETLAHDTGGMFFNNDNDLEAGFRRAFGLSDAYYVLAFSPQNLKTDGAFHSLQVKLVSARGYTVQARQGYYAPSKTVDPAVQEKEDIREAVYSPDERHELPLDVQTQFFTKSETDVQVTILISLDLHPLHFRKEGDRNIDNLTFVTVLFDMDGHPAASQAKTVELRLLDSTLQRYLETGVTIKTVLDVRPGPYVVRTVVHDSENGLTSSLKHDVVIPY